MDYEVFEDKKYKGDWRVEAIDADSGDIYVAVFAGPDAEARAHEYAAWQRTLYEERKAA